MAKILRAKLKGIDQKLRKAKQLVHDLKHKRDELRALLIREERKRRDNPYASRGSSRTNVSIDRGGGGQKWHMNWNEQDDLNESFFSVNTSISRSPVFKDRTTSSIETSFVEGRSHRDNRFGPRKSPLSRSNKRNKENNEEEMIYLHSTELKDHRDSNNLHQEYLSTNPTLGNGEAYQSSEFGNKFKKRDPKQIFLKKNTPEWGESRKTPPWERRDFDPLHGLPDEVVLEKSHSKDSFAKKEDLLKLINDIKEFDTGEIDDFEAETFGTNLLKEADSQ